MALTGKTYALMGTTKSGRPIGNGVQLSYEEIAIIEVRMELFRTLVEECKGIFFVVATLVYKLESLLDGRFPEHANEISTIIDAIRGNRGYCLIREI